MTTQDWLLRSASLLWVSAASVFNNVKLYEGKVERELQHPSSPPTKSEKKKEKRKMKGRKKSKK